MRPLVLASAILLVLSGCAAAETESRPAATAQVQSTQSTEPSQTSEPESSEPSEQEAETAEAETQEREAEGSEESETESESESESTSQARATSTPEATESEDSEEASEAESEEQEPTQTPTPTPTQEPTPEPEIVGYTLAEVAQKNTSSDCWVAIDGGVYDLTMWIRSHPGGSGAITQLCGTDGTQQFLGRHGGQSRPAAALDGYYIGPLR